MTKNTDHGNGAPPPGEAWANWETPSDWQEGTEWRESHVGPWHEYVGMDPETGTSVIESVIAAECTECRADDARAPLAPEQDRPSVYPLGATPKGVTLRWEDGTRQSAHIAMADKARAFAYIDNALANAEFPNSLHFVIYDNGVPVWGQMGSFIEFNN